MIPQPDYREKISQAINRLLALDPDFPAKLKPLEDNTFVIDVLGLELRIPFSIRHTELQIMPESPGTPDVMIRGAPLALVKLAAMDDPTPLLQAGEIEIQGDVALGKKFKHILSALDIDWEGVFAEYVGDIPAHSSGQIVRKLLNWKKRSADSLTATFSEYLQEESRDLPTRIEVENFMDEVDTLREHADRLQARIENLEKT